MSNAFWAWTLTVQHHGYDSYEWSGCETYCSSEQCVAARIFASREDAEAHFRAWFSDKFDLSWGDDLAGEWPYADHSLEIYTLAV